MRRDLRRLLGIASGLLVVAGAVVAVELRGDGAPPVEDNPVALVAATPSTAPAPVVPSLPEVTTTLPAAAAVEPALDAPLDAPVPPPADPYEEEPIVQIGTIEIAKIGLVHPIFHGISMLNIDKGPSHWPGSAMPGEVGNAVFAGHRVTKTRPFRHIDRLVPGDEVVFTVHGRRSVYVVTEAFVVTPKRLDIVDPTPTATATLFACHPPGSARERYVVRLALVA